MALILGFKSGISYGCVEVHPRSQRRGPSVFRPYPSHEEEAYPKGMLPSAFRLQLI
jgi:hypothetical protein